MFSSVLNFKLWAALLFFLSKFSLTSIEYPRIFQSVFSFYKESKKELIFFFIFRFKIPFFSLFSIVDVDGSEKSWPLPEGKYDFKYPDCRGCKYEAEEIRKQIRSGKTQSDYITQNDSLLLVRIMDEIRKQIGVKYAADY